MTRESWFNSEDKSQSVIRPELQDISSNDLPPNLLAVFSQNVLRNFTGTEVLYQESYPLNFFGGESILYKSRRNKNLVAIEGAINAPIGVSVFPAPYLSKALPIATMKIAAVREPAV